MISKVLSPISFNFSRHYWASNFFHLEISGSKPSLRRLPNQKIIFHRTPYLFHSAVKCLSAVTLPEGNRRIISRFTSQKYLNYGCNCAPIWGADLISVGGEGGRGVWAGERGRNQLWMTGSRNALEGDMGQDKPWEKLRTPCADTHPDNTARRCTMTEPLPERERGRERGRPSSARYIPAAQGGGRRGGGLLNSLLSPFLCVFLCEWVCHFSVWENSSHSLFLCVTQECPPWEEHEYSSTLKTWTQHQHTEKHCVLIKS